jgi:hypothetical protein
MRAFISRSGLVLLALVLASPASAQVVQSLHLGVGGVFPRGLDARHDDDVLLRNWLGRSLPGAPELSDALAFEFGDFKAAQLLGEWTWTFGERIEVGAGVGFYRKTVPTLYYDLEDNGRDINQELSLRVAPITGIVRFLPFGRAGDVQPYVGAGLALLNFRYTEEGDFVDEDTLVIFPERYTVSNQALGGLLLGGVRLPLGGDIYSLGIEGRYQFGVGDLDKEKNGFVAEKIDLGSGQLNFTFSVRF